MTFDNIYHEHYNYWSLTSLNNFFKQLNATIFRSEKINTHGGSIRIYVSKEKNKKVESSVKKLLIEEKSLELQNLKLMKILARKSIKLEKI